MLKIVKLLSMHSCLNCIKPTCKGKGYYFYPGALHGSKVSCSKNQQYLVWAYVSWYVWNYKKHVLTMLEWCSWTCHLASLWLYFAAVFCSYISSTIKHWHWLNSICMTDTALGDSLMTNIALRLCHFTLTPSCTGLYISYKPMTVL